MAIDSKAFDGVHAPTFPRLMKRRCDGCIAMFRNAHGGVVLWSENAAQVGNEFSNGQEVHQLDWEVFTGTITLRNA